MKFLNTCSGLHSAVSGPSNCRSRGCEIEPQLGHITFVEIDHEIISTAFLPISLIQEKQLTGIDENMCTSTPQTRCLNI